MLTQSSKHERQVAEQLSDVYGNAAVQPGSGNTEFAPNDVRVAGELMVECKCTASASIGVTWEWLERARHLAGIEKLRSVIALQFHKYSKSVYYVIEDVDYLHLLKCEMELRKLTNGR